MPRKDKEERRKYSREHYQTHKEQYRKWFNEYYQKNKKRCLELNREYRKTHKVQCREYGKLRRANSKYKLNNSISISMGRSLRNGKGGASWESYVDFTREDLARHLEGQFTKEMNWNNQGSYWHLDHIIPISAFNYDSVEHTDFKRCWALSNLRPLEKIENMKKQDKINKPFQPSLRI